MMDVFRGRVQVGGEWIAYGKSPECHPGDIPHQKDRQTLHAYEQVFSGWSPRAVLEVGVCDGGSLLIWRALWPAARVVGVDCRVPPDRAMAAFVGLHVEFIHREMPAQLDLPAAGFDLVIDDGAHGYTSVASNFEICWPLVAPGGRYVVEDWHLPEFDPGRIGGLLAETVIGADDGAHFCDGDFPPNSALRVEVYRRMIVVYKRGGDED